MKKIIFGFLLITISISVSGKNLNEIISEFSKAPRADKVSIGSSAWSLIKVGNLGDKDNFTNKINSLLVLDLEDCSQDVKSNFLKQIENIDINHHDLLMKIKDDTDHVLIFSKSKKDKIKEFILVSVNDPAIIRIKGNFRLDDLADVTKKYAKKKN